LIATLLFFASVVIHELSHWLMANRMGQEVRRITLFIFGGMAHLSREPRNARTEFLIAVVGPLTSLALGGIFWLVGQWLRDLVAPLWAAVFHYLGFINVALGVFNLLPGFPLDGGRLLRSILWMRSGDLRAATARAANWGGGIAIGLMLLGGLQIFAGALVGGLWLIFIGMFLRGAAQASYHGVVVDQALSGATAGELMMSKKAPRRSTSCSSRARAAARSKRNPSTCISSTQYRRLSMMSCRERGCVMSSVLPQPV
jgi:Zn-dependent protease